MTVLALNDYGLIAATANYNNTNTAIDPTPAGEHAVLLFPMQLAVDGNRDGTVSFGSDDVTTSDKPERFWLNNDFDNADTTPGSNSPEPTTGTPDSSFDYIVNARDLEDWTRLWIKIGGFSDQIKSGQILVGLKWRTVASGAPGIKIAQATDSDGGLGYLTDATKAQAQAGANILVDALAANNGSRVTLIAPTSNPADFTFSPLVWQNMANGQPTYFLFEGVQEGKGELEVVFLRQDGTKFGEGGSIWLDLKDIKEMYLRGKASAVPDANLPWNWFNSQPPNPGVTAAVDSTGGTFVPDPNEDTSNPTCVVAVHGFNQSEADSTNFAETMFKRLWQKGYKGRFVSFRWDTRYANVWTDYIPVGIYNDCEYIAWSSGGALKNFLQQNVPSGYNINIAAHSMGNIVAGEALRQGLAVNHYALLHAASSASCYSQTPPDAFTEDGTLRVPPDHDPDTFTSSLGYTGYLNTIKANRSIVNFSEPKDEVINSIWWDNYMAFKPQAIILNLSGGYHYDTTQPAGEKVWVSMSFLGIPLPVTRTVYSSSESKAYVDYSLTDTIGHSTELKGAIKANVDESAMGKSHSYEWNCNLQDSVVQNFYDNLMTTFEIPLQ